jgi:hypothetical protein
MAVPETTVDEDSDLPAGYNDIWSTRQITAVQSEAQPFGKESSANKHFWLGVFSSDACHHSAALLWIDNVRHLNVPWLAQLGDPLEDG